MRKPFGWMIALSAITVLSSQCAGALQYSVRRIEVPGVANSDIMDINNRGQILTTNKIINPDGSVTNLSGNFDYVSGGTPEARILSDSGLVAGYISHGSYSKYGEPITESFSCEWNANGTCIGLRDCRPYSINDAGMIAGSVDFEFMKCMPILVSFSSQTMTETDFGFGGHEGVAFSVNNNNVVVGTTMTAWTETGPAFSAFKWSAESGSTLLCEGVAYDINDRGQIVCTVGWGEAAIIEPDGSFDYIPGLHLQSSWNWSDCRINESGTVLANGSIWTAKDGLVATLPGYTYHDTCKILDNGSVFGYALDARGVQYAALWEPTVPEPSCILAMVVGLAGVGGLALRKRK